MAVDLSPQFLKAYVAEKLPSFLPEISPAAGGLAAKAAAYSVAVGGKRIRPLLLLATAAMFDVAPDDAMPFAAAVEMIHTYSLIHDDLPAMDNDLLRRGQPSCHAVFGEDIAILAGDGLLNLAFETLIGALAAAPTPARLLAASELARASGFHGMVAGQCLDLADEVNGDPAEILRTIQDNKTGALIRAAVRAGARLGAADEPALELLTDFAGALGLSFQIRDDILDARATSEALGKTAGKDVRDGKLTFVTHYGIDQAEGFFDREMARAGRALAGLGRQGLQVSTLESIWRYLETRTA